MDVLFLCCSSNRKLAGGEGAYRPAGSMPQAVSRRNRDLLAARRAVFDRIADGAPSMQGALLRDLPYNAHPPLVPGPDLGGEAGGKYIPAMARYRGRFYEALDPDGRGVLGESPHHWLIVSTLYGLLTLEEPIQRYSCHTQDDPGIASVWMDEGLLTSLLLEYVHLFGVGLIVDLTADGSYHDLFEWERIAADTGVLRAFGAQNAGPALLPALGQLVRDRLLRAPAQELLGIEEHRTYLTDYEDVVLTRSYLEPPEGFLLEPSPARDQEPDPSAVAHDGPDPSAPPEPSSPDPVEECVILPRPREIRVTSGGHGTIFGYQITRIRDLPRGVRPLFDDVSRLAEVLEVQLGRFHSKDRSRDFVMRINEPGYVDSGAIDGSLTGPGKIGGTQEFRIRVTPGRERSTFLALEALFGET